MIYASPAQTLTSSKITNYTRTFSEEGSSGARSIQHTAQHNRCFSRTPGTNTSGSATGQRNCASPTKIPAPGLGNRRSLTAVSSAQARGPSQDRSPFAPFSSLLRAMPTATVHAMQIQSRQPCQRDEDHAHRPRSPACLHGDPSCDGEPGEWLQREDVVRDARSRQRDAPRRLLEERLLEWPSSSARKEDDKSGPWSLPCLRPRSTFSTLSDACGTWIRRKSSLRAFRGSKDDRERPRGSRLAAKRVRAQGTGEQCVRGTDSVH